MRVLVATVVHHTTDARVFRREIGALRDAGIEVTAIAPWPADSMDEPGYAKVRIPRAVGRRRWASWRAARARVSAHAVGAQVLIIHDPELLVVIPWRELRRLGVRVIWDVHEDLAAALAMKAYIPVPLRRLLVPAVHLLERWAEHRAVLLLAERSYAERFARQHELVLNLPPVPDTMPRGPRERQAVYVGSITRARGLDEMLAMAPLLAASGIVLRLIGEVPSAADRARIEATANVIWEGALPNAEALHEVSRSMVGLALLHDQANYRHSMPTKILEYMASGTAVVATPLPLSREVVGGDGIVLSAFGDAAEAARAVVTLCDDDEARERMTRAAYERVRAQYNWDVAKHAFVAAVRG